MKCYKIDKDGAAKAIDITDSLESYYREIECDCIDIACLTVDEVELLEESTLSVATSRNDEEISYREILLVD